MRTSTSTAVAIAVPRDRRRDGACDQRPDHHRSQGRIHDFKRCLGRSIMPVKVSRQPNLCARLSFALQSLLHCYSVYLGEPGY